MSILSDQELWRGRLKGLCWRIQNDEHLPFDDHDKGSLNIED